MIYTKQMRQAVRQIAVPKGFVMDIVEFDDGKARFLLLRFYSDQWDSMSESERFDAGMYMRQVRRVLIAHGVNVSLDPVLGSPR